MLSGDVEIYRNDSTLGEDPKHVIKILKGHKIKEIVLKYFGGQYLIYEINAKD